MWKIVGGPREFNKLETRDISVGWAWDIEQDGERRIVRVCVAGTTTLNYPEECRRAISTYGRSAVERVLLEADPALTIGVTTTQLTFE